MHGCGGSTLCRGSGVGYGVRGRSSNQGSRGGGGIEQKGRGRGGIEDEVEL